MAEPSLMRVGSEKAVPQRPIPKATPRQRIVGTETIKKREQNSEPTYPIHQYQQEW
jgi:hypothetical protein